MSTRQPRSTPDWTIPPCEPHPTMTDQYVMLQPCDDDCHHPLHAFGRPERRPHLIEADLAEFALSRGWIE